MKKVFTQDEKNKIVELYNQCLSLRAIAKEFSISRKCIKKIIDEFNIDIRHDNYLTNKRKINESEYENIVELYKSGLYATEIAEKYNVSSTTILNILKTLNVPINRFIRKTKFSEKDIRDMCDLYDSGKTLLEISMIYDVDKSEISFLFNKIGKQCKDCSHAAQIYNINEEFFDVIDTQEKAYVLGMLYADGNNYTKTNKVRIGLQARDVHILEDILRVMDSNIPLSFYKSKYENCQDIYVLTISNKHISETLNNLGMVPNKSLILEFPEWLDENLYPHFIRGYFDGDGWVAKPKGYYGTSIVSTKNFCERVQEILTDIGVVSKIYNTYNEETSTRELKIGKKESSKIFLDYIYKDATIYLNRKHDIYVSKFCNNINNSLSV